MFCFVAVCDRLISTPCSSQMGLVLISCSIRLLTFRTMIPQLLVVPKFYHLAGTFSRGFEEAYSALMRLEDSKADNGRIPTIEERLQLSYDIFKIDNTEMARVLTGNPLMHSSNIPYACTVRYTLFTCTMNLLLTQQLTG